MPQARMLMPFRSAISLRCAIAFGSSSISIASLVPFGFDGDQTLAFACGEEAERELRLVEIADVRDRHAIRAGIEDFLDARLGRLRAVLARSAGCGRSASCGCRLGSSPSAIALTAAAS